VPELVYKKAGRIELIRYRDGKRFLKNGVVQSMAPQIINNTATLPDGNSAMGLVFSSGKAAQVVVNLNSFQPSLYAALVAGDVTDGTGISIRKIEENSVPAASPFTVTLAKTPVNDSIVIHNEDDSPFVKVASSPATGQYSVSANVVTFNSTNANEEVIIAYDVSAASAKQMSLSAEANNDTFRLTVAGEAVLRKDEGTTKLDAITFDKVMPTGEIPWPARQKDPQGWNFTLQVLKPRPGYNVVSYAVEN
jgi:hypothetical protein